LQIKAKRKLEMRNITTEDDDTMEAMNEEVMYRYFGHNKLNKKSMPKLNRNLAKRT